MKHTEVYGNGFAIVYGIECRLSTRSRGGNAIKLKKSLVNYYIDKNGFYRDHTHNVYLIKQYTDNVEKRMRKLGYNNFDYDSKEYALVKCYK